MSTYENYGAYEASQTTSEPNEPAGGILSGTVEGDLGIETALALRISDLEKELELAKANAEDWSKRTSEWRTKYTTFENTLKDILVSMVDSSDLSHDAAKYIAEGMGIEVTRTVRITGTVSFTGSVDVSMFEDIDEMSHYNLYADLSLNYDSEDVSLIDYDIDEAEFEESSY